MMNKLKRRLPPKSETIHLFLGCVFLIHIWSILMFLRKVPAYLGRMDLETMLGVFAYTQIYALIESVMILFILVSVGILLPKRYFRDNFLSLGLIYFLVTFIWMMPIHYSIRARFIYIFPLSQDIQLVLALVWVLLYFYIIYTVPVLIRRNKGLGRGIKAFINRTSVLSVMYLLVDFACLITVFYRNIR
jgi:hypothetical protein